MLYSDEKRLAEATSPCVCVTVQQEAKSPENFRALRAAGRFCLEALLLCQSEKPAYILFSLYSVPHQAWLCAKVWYVGFVPLCILYQPVENSVPWPGYSIP